MNVYIRHIALPAIAPTTVVGLYFTPVSLFGCVNRGLMALAVVLVSAVAALSMAIIGLRAKVQNQTTSDLRLVSIFILILPIILVLGPLG